MAPGVPRFGSRLLGLVPRLALAAPLLAAAAAPAAGIGIGPYLQNTATDAVTVIWWTDFSAAGLTNRVEYGAGLTDVQAAAESYVAVFTNTGFGYRQEARLSGLQADSLYEYRARSGDGARSHTSAVYSFRTAPAPSSGFRFAVLGDGQSDDAASIARHVLACSNVLARGASLALYHGDMVQYGSGTTPESDRYWGVFLTNVLCAGAGQSGSGLGNRIPVFMAAGNHEIYRSGAGYAGGNRADSMARFQAACANPGNGSTNAHWAERYYAFAWGPCYFICLDANNTSGSAFDNHDTLNAGDTPDWEPGSEQYQWLIGRLDQARRQAAFTFVFFHVAPYARGVHGTDSPAIDGQRGYEVRALDPVFRQYGVDGVFNGHDHLVERCLTGPEEGGGPANAPGGPTNAAAWPDERNLNYFVQGNIRDARAAQAGWTNWMSIADNGEGPYYTAYFYDWGGTTNLYVSFNEVDISYQAAKRKWQADFRVVRSDLSGNTSEHDVFSIQRDPPPGIRLSLFQVR